MPEPQKGGTRLLSRNPEPASRKPRPGLGGALLACAIAVFGAIGALAASAAGGEPWITTWAATPAPRWAEELPAPFGVPEVLQDQTVRQVARVSVGGDQVRVVLSERVRLAAGDRRRRAALRLPARRACLSRRRRLPGTAGRRWSSRRGRLCS